MKRGFTLVEMLVVLGVTTLLLVVASVNLRSFQSRASVSQAAEEIESHLRDAQSRSMAVVNGQIHGVHFDTVNHTYTLFEASYIPENPTNTVYALDASVIFGNILLQGGVSDVLFDKLTGSTSQNGTLTLRSTLNSSVEQTISISNEGKISGQ